MNTPGNRPGRALLRAAAATAAAALGAVAFAPPALAQAPTPEAAYVEDYSPVTAGDEPTLLTAQVIFGEDFPTGVHEVTASIAIDAPEGVFTTANDAGDDDCAPDEAGTLVACAREAAGTSVYFDFLYAAAAEAEAGAYDYTVDFAVDGEIVAAIADAIEVAPAAGGSSQPYRHGAVDAGEVDPGESAGVKPVILQEEALAADAAAVVVVFDDQQTLVAGNSGVDVLAEYDNCTADESGDGAVCVIADVEDAPGQAFTFTGEVGYRLAEDAPGPFEHCGCEYRVTTVTEEEAEAAYGEGVLDIEGDLLGLTATSAGDREFASAAGQVTLSGTANAYDLKVTGVDAAGGDGDEATVAVPVANEGPASAYGFFDGPGSYAVLGELPRGAELESIADGDEWNCFTGQDMASYLGDEVTAARLAELDFACLFHSLETGDRRELKVTVSIADGDAKGAGSVEVVAFDHEHYPGDFENDTKDNIAGFTLNGSDAGSGSGSGKLPVTGTPMTVIYVAAAAALVAGVLLFVLGRRRRTGGEADGE